jgi:hypothetical protein
MRAGWINGKDKFAAMMLRAWCQEITANGCATLIL